MDDFKLPPARPDDRLEPDPREDDSSRQNEWSPEWERHVPETPSLFSGGHELCFVGDTLFAGSIGRSNPFSLYPDHLQSVRERVLQLPNETVLLPGHGPATTVKEEIVNNPFGT